MCFLALLMLCSVILVGVNSFVIQISQYSPSLLGNNVKINRNIIILAIDDD